MINPRGMKEGEGEIHVCHTVVQSDRGGRISCVCLSKAFRFSIKLAAERVPRQETFTSDDAVVGVGRTGPTTNFHSSSSAGSPAVVVSLEEDIREFLPTSAYLEATDLPWEEGEGFELVIRSLFDSSPRGRLELLL